MYVQNVGPGEAGPFTVAIYGSCPGESLSQAPREVPGLAPGAQKFISIKFTFSHVGECQLGAEIDDGHQVTESNEDNNTISVSITSE